MEQKIIFLTILGMGAVTFLPRLLPVWVLSSRKLPPLVIAWLRFVPVAVLSAMLLPALLVQNGQLDFSSSNLFLWAAIPTFLTAWKTRSLFGSVIVGMLVVAVVRFWGG
ncbi:MAG TPA: AzlD domain-containing protein [Chloroflexi bacterium]|nr:AzlD domain-containing protein [Chloroflexota bacterium]HBY06950.1 AzlD domain-containing protein [Chloroflexota bacterium]